MSALAQILRYIKISIPPQLLETVFRDKLNQGLSLDAILQKEIIRDQMLQDLSLRCGSRLVIYLQDDWRIPMNSMDRDEYYMGGTADLYRIPPSARNNKDIISAHFAGYRMATPRSGLVIPTLFPSTSTLPSATDQLIASYANDSTYQLRVAVTGVGTNVITITPTFVGNVTDISVELIVSFDEDFSTIDHGALSHLMDLGVLCAKRYINNNRIYFGSQALEYGQDNTLIMAELDKYTDLEQTYQDTIDLVASHRVMSPEQQAKIISMCM